MEILPLIRELLQDAGLISLFLTVHALRKESEARRFSNTLSFEQQFHSIWNQAYERPELFRIKNKDVVLDTNPLTDQEELFVTQLIIHLTVVHRAMKAKVILHIEGITEDIRYFFSLPIPKAVWELKKKYQNQDFIEFIEESSR